MKPKRHRKKVLTFENFQDRAAFIIAQRTSGVALESIGKSLGITRERVRQVAVRNGLKKTPLLVARTLNGAVVDPIAILKFARSRECRSMSHCAQHLGLPLGAVHRVCRALRVNKALNRLYRLRRFVERRNTIVAAIQTFVETHGRYPTVSEMNSGRDDLPWPAWCSFVFRKPWTEVRETLGIPQRPLGGPGHLKDWEKI
jgi:hypothetical protein